MRTTLILLSVLILSVPLGAAQDTALDVNPGMIAPDSPLYGLGVAKDNLMLTLGLTSPGTLAQKRAAEAQQMREKGNYAAAERAAQEMSKVAEQASESDATDITKATAVLQDIHENAPEASKDGLRTAMDSVSDAVPEDAPTEVPTDTPGDAGSEPGITRTAVSCDEGLFETHAHAHAHGMGDPSTPGSLAAAMDDHGVRCGVMFMEVSDIEDGFAAVREDLARTDIGIVPFIAGDNHMSARTIDRLADDVDGLGEMVFYAGPLEGKSLEDGSMPLVYEKAAEQGMVVMIHPTEVQADEMEAVVTKYEDVDFLLHGFEMLRNVDRAFLPSLLAEHGNVYWTHDFAVIAPEGRMPLVEMQNKDELENWWSQTDQEQFIADHSDEIERLMDAAPDSVMWGTDIFKQWQTDPDAYAIFIEISNRIIDELPEEHRDAYAYENAQRLFGPAIGFEAPDGYDFSKAGDDEDAGRPGGTGDTGSGTTSEGLGDLCDSKSGCMMYCMSNEQDCIDYCMTAPGNEICQTLQEMDGGAQPSSGGPGGQETWDLEENGVPRFITHPVEPDVSTVTTVSKFRSAAGHDYSTDMERCRTMKHYINGPQDGDPLPVIAPADGTIDMIQEEQSGGDSLVFLKPDGYPAFQIRMHHVTLADGIERGTEVSAGDKLGVRSFIGGKWDTVSAGEIAIAVNTPEGRTYVSYFNAMTDDVFARYQEAHGIESRDAFIISQEERDADPLDCNEDSKEEEYTGRINKPGWSLEQFHDWAYQSDNWVILKELEARR